MPDADALLQQLYDAFNRRDIDGCLALMTSNVYWPKASEGGRVTGKNEIRAYWTRQWAEFNPNVQPLYIKEYGSGLFGVEVRQRIKDLEGRLLSDQIVTHIFSVTKGRVSGMAIGDAEPAFGR